MTNLKGFSLRNEGFYRLNAPIYCYRYQVLHEPMVKVRMIAEEADANEEEGRAGSSVPQIKKIDFGKAPNRRLRR